MRLGANIFGGRTYHDPLIYRDLMRQASVFGGDYGSPRGQALPALRADGYPAGVAGTNTPGAVVIQSPTPAGAYAVRMEGRGTVALQWGATQPSWRVLTSDGSGAMTTTIDLPALPAGSQVTAVVRASDPSDPVRNLSIAMPGEGTFRAEFLADITGFAVHRHMDSRRINADPAVAWADQPASGLNSLWRGVPFEDLCAMANETGADPWFCIPYHADAGYIESMARLIDASLDAGRKVYVEYSNELWNWGFEQAQAVAKWDADNPPSVGRQVVIGRQAAAAMARFRAAMSSSRRCIRVVSGQAGWIEDSRVACLTAADLDGLDAIACAPYFASFGSADVPALKSLGARWAAGETAAALDGLFAMVGPTVETALSWTRKWRALADQIGVPLHLYECGQHLNSPDDAALTSLMIAANRDARMGPLYTAYLDGLRDAGVDVACLYNSHGAASKWGSWGLREHVGQPDSEAPKAAAVRAWMDANPAEPEPVGPDPEPVDPEPVAPTPDPEPVDPEPPAPRVVLSVDVVADADGALSLRLRP